MTTIQNVDPMNHSMKRTLQQGFSKMTAKGLNLKLDKKKALVDFLACIPELQRQMEQRLVYHCQSRIVDEKKRSHWCLEWGAQNFPQVAAIMCLFGQAKSDLSCLDSNQCLLAGINAFLRAKNNASAALEGSHLCWDCNNQEWIRSGKAVGSNFNKRNTQHANGAKLTTTASQMRNISFY